MITAAHRHARLQRHYNDTAHSDVKGATWIHRCWFRSAGTGKAPPADRGVDAYVAAYPDLDLASILADTRRQVWNTPARSPARACAVDTVHARLAEQ